jgi:hypothetical protein
LLPAVLGAVLCLTACGAEAWERDPEVRAAKKACKQLDERARTTCIEGHAVETLNPDVCHLAGIWIDDMCLQAVYEAAGDPAICDQLYLEGVRPACRAYYAPAAVPMLRYSDAALGFAAEVPSNWAIGDHTDYQDPLGRWWSSVEFRSGLHAYGHQAFNQYGIRVQAGPSPGSTLTETVELSLSPLIPAFRDQVQMHCCLAAGGEQAMELLNYPPTRWGNRRIVVLHGGWEYRLDFFPLAGMTTSTPAGVEAQVAFETFLRTFAFVPITVTPEPPAATITPVPTPTRLPTSSRRGPERPSGGPAGALRSFVPARFGPSAGARLCCSRRAAALRGRFGRHGICRVGPGV